LSAAAVLPYSLAMNPAALEKLQAASKEPSSRKNPPQLVIILAGVVQTGVLIAVASFVGLLASRHVGLQTPLLSAWVGGQPAGDLFFRMLPATIVLGGASGVLILALERYFFAPRIPRSLAGFDRRTSFWKRALACFYGGIVEELLLRLFLMSGFAWLIGLVWNTTSGLPTVGAFWLANLLAALLFGAGHLPATAAITRLTPIVVARGLLLNGIPGLVFGYLFMTYGLESAMIAHFSLDILIHLIYPLLPAPAGLQPADALSA
jgi:hypothetical protein